jgi:hypothetical protein
MANDWKPEKGQSFWTMLKSLDNHITEKNDRKKAERNAKIKDGMRRDGVEEADIESQFELWRRGIYDVEDYRKKKLELNKYRKEQYISSTEMREHEKHNAEVGKIIAETESIEVETRRKLELVKMIKQIRKNDLSSFPVELKYFVIACQAGDVEALNDIMNASVLKEYLHRKQEAEVGKMEQEMEDKKVDVENKRMNLDAKRKRL